MNEEAAVHVERLTVKIQGRWYGMDDAWLWIQDGKPPHGRVPRVNGIHECSCSNCDPDLVMQDEHKGVGHFNIHLGDQRLNVFLGDQDWSGHCYEVFCGPNGRALCYSHPTHICERCRKGACSYIALGNFRVALPMAPPR